jgi:hypothetical protein
MTSGISPAPALPAAPTPAVPRLRSVTRFYEDDDRRLCHWIRPDGTRYCGASRSGRGTGRLHYSKDPISNPCDTCGYPRCPTCEAARAREEA